MKAWQTGGLTVLSLQRDCRRSPLSTNPNPAVLPRSTPIFAILTETTTPKNIPLCAAATTPLDKGGLCTFFCDNKSAINLREQNMIG